MRPAVLCGLLCGVAPSDSLRRGGSRERRLLGSVALPPTYSLRAGGGCGGSLFPKSPRDSVSLSDQKCTSWTILQEFKNAIKANQMTFQLVPPKEHKRNIAEKAIHVFKDHFISVLCGADVSFPMQLWCQILRQAEHQLNLLRKSRMDPSKSAFEILYGKQDYNAHPFAPLRSALNCK